MSPLAGDAPPEEDAEDVAPAEEDAVEVAPWCMPGMDEEPLEEPQAASVNARAAEAPTAARPRRRAVKRDEDEVTIEVESFRMGAPHRWRAESSRTRCR
ncbi:MULTISPECIES: hypothetical protein [Streptomyces]